jgi:nitronate monooxygenase
LNADGEEAQAWKTVWSAGQGVSNIHDIPSIASLAERMKQEYNAAKKNLIAKISPAAASPAPKAPRI